MLGSEQLGNFDKKVVITPYHKKQFIIMQIINVSLNLKFKNIICSSSKYLGIYGAPVPLLFSNLITGKKRTLFLLKGGGVTSSSLYAVLVKIFIKIKFSFLCQYICLVLHCIEKKLYRNYSWQNHELINKHNSINFSIQPTYSQTEKNFQ